MAQKLVFKSWYCKHFTCFGALLIFILLEDAAALVADFFFTLPSAWSSIINKPLLECYICRRNINIYLC